MNNLLESIEDWKQAKAKLFKIYKYEVWIDDDHEHDLKSRYLEISGNDFTSKATLWEDGFLELRASDASHNKLIIEKSCSVTESWELEERLDWWFSEITAYDEEE